MVDITKIAAIYADAGHYSGMTVTVGGWAKTCLLYTSDAADE